MENSNFETQTLPEDLQIEILSWLPLKSLERFICVSKTWASIIRGEYFRKIHLNRSMTKPRMMLMVEQERSESEEPEPEMMWFHSIYQEQNLEPYLDDTEVLFHSVYQEEKPLLSSGKQQLRISLETETCTISQPIRGLVCLQLGTKVAICNPGTKKFRTLPEIQAPKNSNKYTFFGYDEATNVFKVLSITRILAKVRRTRYKVCTMGSDWRRITCTSGHVPYSEGLFIGGHLYYVADLNRDRARVIMCFNVMFEVFSVIELPEEAGFTEDSDLVNYNGQIAISNGVDYYTGDLQLWVRDETKVWLSKRFVIPRWKETVEYNRFYFRGTIGTGELVFTQKFFGEAPIVLYYNTDTQIFRRFQIEGLIGGNYVKTFLDHVDSTWLI